MAGDKTLVVKLLEKRGIQCTMHSYAHGDTAVDGMTVAAQLGMDSGRVFKTLVTRGAGGGIYVFDVPVCCELDLKKAARAVGEKSVAMIRVSEINALTGYVRGGCSPIGMKKQYPTVFDETILLYDTVCVSAGRIGSQIELAPHDLLAAVNGKTADITEA